MKTKISAFFTGIIYLTLIMVLMPISEANAKPVILRFCSGSGGLAIHKVAERFGSEVEKRTGGSLKFEYLWGGAVAKPTEELEACRTGLSEMAILLVQYWPSKLALNNFGVSCPFSPNDPKLLTKVVLQLYDEVPDLRAEVEAFNQRIVSIVYGGGYDAQSILPIRHPEDFTGKKIAISGTYWPKLFQAAGAILVSVPFPDRYMALQTKMIHATMSPPTHVREWYDIFTDYTITNSGSFCPFLFSINTDTWNKLPKDLQKIIMEVGGETALWYADIGLKEEEEAMEYLKRKGIKFHTFSDEDLKKWGKIAPEIPLMWIKDIEAAGKPGAKVIERYITTLEKHGYTWPKKWKTSK